MELKLAYYEDCNLKIEIRGEQLCFVSKTNSMVNPQDIQDSMAVFKYVAKCVSEINCESNQPERSKREDNAK